MDAPLISIVVLNWNGREFLEKTIPALEALDYGNKEIIIVDNHSTDGSVEYLKALQGVQTIQNSENVGYSRGKNIGVARAAGEYVLLLDNDILIQSPAHLTHLLAIYQSVNRPAFLCPCLEDAGRNKTIYYKGEFNYLGIRMNRPIETQKLVALPQASYRTQLVFGGNLFFKKEIWNDLGGFDEMIPFNLDDNDISIRANLMGYTCYMMIERPLNIHLGAAKRKNNALFANYLRYLLAGHLISYGKNLQWHNVIIVGLYEVGFTFLKSLKNAVVRRDPRMLTAFLYSLFLYLKSIPKILQKRSRIQKRRVISDHDYFTQRVRLV